MPIAIPESMLNRQRQAAKRKALADAVEGWQDTTPAVDEVDTAEGLAILKALGMAVTFGDDDA